MTRTRKRVSNMTANSGVHITLEVARVPTCEPYERMAIWVGLC